MTQNNPKTFDSDPSMPGSVVYDIFADTATRLGGEYVYLADRAASPEEKECWKAKGLALRDEKLAVSSDDRAAQVGHVNRWRAELNELRSR